MFSWSNRFPIHFKSHLINFFFFFLFLSSHAFPRSQIENMFFLPLGVDDKKKEENPEATQIT